jgi:ATP-dependent DNA ligase
MAGRRSPTKPTQVAEPDAAAADPSSFLLPLETAAMEARLEDALPAGDWLYQPKWDGFRCLAFKAGHHVELRAKSGKPLNRYFPEVVALLREMRTEPFVADGELVVETGGRLSFDALQMRLHPAESRIRKLSSETPARLVLFDLLAHGPEGVLLAHPLIDRWAALQHLTHEIAAPGRLMLSPATRRVEEAQGWLQDAGNHGTDGVVAKALGEPYAPGERTMVKVKRLRTADCVVGGFRYRSKGGGVGSLLLGLYDEQGLLDHVGFTSAISTEERPALTARLEAIAGPPGFTGKAPGGPSRWSTERSGDWQPVRPELVVEVRFDHVTGDRFRHGTTLLRWRPDKAARQCTFAQLANGSSRVKQG